MGDEPTDASLVTAAREGSDMAFARLVDRHQQAVRGFARRICGLAADADDIAQDTFLEAWVRLRTLKSPASVRSWLLAIAWRKAKMRARSMGRTRARDDAWSQTQPQTAGGEPELALAALQALSELPLDQRAVVSLCHAAGWSHADAAAILNLPLGTVKSHAARGLARMQEVFNDAGL